MCLCVCVCMHVACRTIRCKLHLMSGLRGGPWARHLFDAPGPSPLEPRATGRMKLPGVYSIVSYVTVKISFGTYSGRIGSFKIVSVRV